MHMHYRSNSVQDWDLPNMLYSAILIHVLTYTVGLLFAEHEKQREKLINYNSIVHQADIVNKENVD